MFTQLSSQQTYINLDTLSYLVAALFQNCF